MSTDKAKLANFNDCSSKGNTSLKRMAKPTYKPASSSPSRI